MNLISILYRKELRAYFTSPFGWVILAFIILLQGVSLSTTFKIFHDGPQPEGVLYFILQSPSFWFYYLFAFPLITMRLFADEEKTGTLEALLTAPVRTGQLVTAKFLAAYTFYLILWAPLLAFPAISSLANTFLEWQTGQPSYMSVLYRSSDIYGAYSILILCGALFTAIGLLASALTRSQIIAGITTTGLLVLFFFLGLVPSVWGEFPASPFFHYISVTEHFDSFSRGLIDTRPVVFYLSATILVLAIASYMVDHRRWKR